MSCHSSPQEKGVRRGKTARRGRDWGKTEEVYGKEEKGIKDYTTRRTRGKKETANSLEIENTALEQILS